ncbi:ABC transporter substrate-binding protein [Pseudotabrizicola alkalilacus]|uniref:ABC transporter substrate-binding protein n=1 Tax=Pseudotabrizicola alkalilacus TaxID=2305252 RepID=A0A411Z085_9RHOB|nr:ABC transporter substrate-binding protein [Pseudotabrizicola alkalilacus]RGP36481.1 ABC transporter substrate-binding protein [Pseudotabrizicola alkalilacus]
MRKLLTSTGMLVALMSPAHAEATKIGVITTLSGPAGYLGEQIRDGLTLGLQATGAEFELVVEDDARDPNTGVQVADRMLNEEGIKLLTGIVFSNVSGAVVPETLDAGAIYVSPNAAPSGLAGAKCHPNYFVVSWQNDSLHEASGAAAKKLGYTTAVALAPNYQAGKDAIAGFSREFGGTVTEIYTGVEQSDFAGEMAQIRNAAPQVVFQFHPGGQGIAFLKQYQQAGLLGSVPMVLSEPSYDGVILKAVGPAAVGLTGTTHWNDDFDNAASKAMVAEWAAAFPTTPLTTYAQQAYDTGLLIGGALNKVGGEDIEALQAALKAADFASTRGSFAFGANQHPVQDWYLTSIEADEAGNPKIVTKEKILEAVGDVYAADCKM